MSRLHAVVLVTFAVLLTGCGSAATSRSQVEPPKISQYKGWTIAATPARVDTNQWRARVRVWPPEVRPSVHPGINLTVNETLADRQGAEEAATAAARRYIDGSLAVPAEPK